MVLLLVFSLPRGSHIYTTSKVPKGGEVILLGCSFLNWRSNCMSFYKGIEKLDSMVQGIWKKIVIQVSSS